MNFKNSRLSFIASLGFGVGPLCVGWNVTMGNHVGDWERMEMRFVDGQPTDLYLNAHT